MSNDDNVVEMLESFDKDCVYLAVSMIRNSKNLFSSNTVKRIKTISLFDRVKYYSDVCDELGVRELTIVDFIFLPEEQRLKALSSHQIQNICKLFNGDWVLDWDNSKQYKWCPWFQKRTSGWVVNLSAHRYAHSYAAVGYYKDEKTSNHCANLFLDIYINFYS